jgi:hypothetical protein
MNILRFCNIFKVIEQKVPLGRWGINNCQNKINTKVDLSNEDHCGPCSYTPKKDNINNVNINEAPKDEVEIRKETNETNKIHVKNESKNKVKIEEETNKIPFSSLFVIFFNK